MPSRQTAIIFSANQGHASIAAAAQALLEPKYDTIVVQWPIKMAGFYTVIYRYLPQFFGLIYRMSTSPSLLKLAETVFRLSDTRKIEALVAKHDPALCVVTYFSYLPCLENWQQRTGRPVINLIANPRTTHPVELAPAPFINCVFDEQQANLCQKLRPGCITTTLGWLVKPHFIPNPNKKQLRTSLGLDPTHLTFTLLGGSEGAQVLHKVTLFLMTHANQALQLIVICGHNQLLQTQLTDWQAHQSESIQKRLIVLGFTDQVEKYVQAADVVIGKAGPNTLFETVCCLVPFVAITHIRGQETGNLEILTEQNVGEVLERWPDLVAFLDEVATQPTVLDQFQAPLSKFATYLRASDNRFHKLLQTTIPTL